MATLARNFGSKVVKNVGDALIFYFPDTSSPENRTAFKEVLECCTAIIAAREFINRKLDLEFLPHVSYRISADYGKVEVGTTVNSGKEDLFGPTVSICAKINTRAEPNGIVIGGDLYEVLKRFSFDQEYEFKEVKAWSIGMRYSYSVYSVKGKDRLLFEDSKVLNLFKRTTTTTTQPMRREEEGSTSPAIQQKQKESYRVMIVDDEADVLAVFKSFLLSEGFNVEAFSDSYKALVAFSRSEPLHYDLIILDIRMPSMNGLQLYQRLKAIDPSIKVIFLSALEATEELVSILEGVSSVDVLRKPIDKKHFIQKVKSSVAA
jgi:CheY-like chemotaxis protein